jgi:hypothetical protein
MPKVWECDFEEDSSNHDMDGSCDVLYHCLDCECRWYVGLFQQYTDDDIIKED